jgi:hypothetical protein
MHELAVTEGLSRVAYNLGGRVLNGQDMTQIVLNSV